jgi:hypothetical protein
MAANDVVTKRALRIGIGILLPSVGLDSLAALMAHTWQPFSLASTVAVVPFDWAVALKVCCAVWELAVTAHRIFNL